MAVELEIKNQIAYITFDDPRAKVNILTSEVMRSLNSVLSDILRVQDTLKAVVLQSRKPDCFIAGADIKEIEDIVDPEEGRQKSTAGQIVFDKLEDLPIPSLAVIDGVALGGGCELALACTYRLVTFHPKTCLGLPEVQLGIIPGFGGTYRLPRLIDLDQALTMILTGNRIAPEKALKMGLVHQVVPRCGLEQSVGRFLGNFLAGSRLEKPFLPKNPGRYLLQHTPFGRALIFKNASRKVRDRTKGFYPAPLRAIEVVKQGWGVPRKEALNLEATAFGKLVAGDICKNLIKVFYLTEKYRKLSPPQTEEIKPAAIQKCGVLGAGVMGGGIAQILSGSGIDVRLKDIRYPALAKGLEAAHQVFARAVEKRQLTPAAAAADMARITGTIDYRGFQRVDAVIEAVVEDLAIKKSVFRELADVIGETAVICTNTSALSVTAMAREIKHPQRVIGFHFFNPVHLMPLVEIIQTEMTSAETLATAIALAKRLRKIPILVKDAPGFLVNRLLLSYINEAGRVLEEGGNIKAIDQLVIQFGMPMGPLILADEVGLDVGIKVLRILQEKLGERYRPVETFVRLYEQGFLGKKAGKGFYIHQGRKQSPNKAVFPLVAAHPSSQISEQDTLDRMILIMINEAAQCLDEGIIDGPGTVDAGMMMGAGFPYFRGGLLRYADSLGLARVVERLQYLEKLLEAPRFRPHDLLLKLVSRDQGFYKHFSPDLQKDHP
jgi:3-hydroxyacyl-CoA dehydrogenase/enoyl-CoA hydratase/3-hydroxybutyryl-CoA epimerase